jgi:hypothetical protein
LNDPKREARALRLTFARVDGGRKFDIVMNGERIAEVELPSDKPEEFYTRDYELPMHLTQDADGYLFVKFIAKDHSVAGGLYGLRLLRKSSSPAP